MVNKGAVAPKRIVVEAVSPEVDGGNYPARGIIGEVQAVEADIYADGHDEISATLLWKKDGTRRWSEVPMAPLGNDRWRAEFPLTELGLYRFTFTAWINRFLSWKRDLAKRLAAGQDVTMDLAIGAEIIKETAGDTPEPTAGVLLRHAERLVRGRLEERLAAAQDAGLEAQMRRYSPQRLRVAYDRELLVRVEPELARCSAWYELFPRSWALEPGRHGTFRDLEARLPYIAEMGFDVLYLTPIHPIGVTHRKGRNNSVTAEPGDPGSPWAIGSAEGGHKAVHPQLGKLADFRRLLAKARKLGMEVAMDIALQCSPDHPYVREHPEWFRKRPDGTIQYAENPPKKYQDIYPLDFETEDWKALWAEVKSIFEFWIEQGVTIFRVDNPHTKPFKFWEWCLAEVKSKRPDIIFLSEAFTRPKVMYHLAKVGFTQSYTYFPWRVGKEEITRYFEELTRPPLCDFFRPSHWTNTPDILIEYLQTGGLPAFRVRLVLAATLGANYGIYGPAFELGVNQPFEAGSEEYRDSEKYQIRWWDLEQPHSLRGLIGRVNRIRKAHRALQSDRSLRFHQVDNGQLIAYSKATPDRTDVILTVVNLDPHHVQSGWVNLNMPELGLGWEEAFVVHDLLDDARYHWKGPVNYVELSPAKAPAHLFHVVRSAGG